MNPKNSRRCGVTLIELIVVMAILAILAGILLASVQRAAQSANEAKTKALIHKLNSQLMLRYESFRTRRVPVSIQPGTDTKTAQMIRQAALYELMRQELPERWEDITTPTLSLQSPVGTPDISSHSVPPSSLGNAYRRKHNNGATTEYQSAECLYLILTTGASKDGIRSSDLANAEVGDIDGDGFFEFHDAWGTPIAFSRWAPGFISELQPNVSAMENPSPFDPLKIVPKESSNTIGQRLVPLIYSAGPDRIYDIQPGSGTSNNPYSLPTKGMAEDLASSQGPANGVDNSLDNITNHTITVR